MYNYKLLIEYDGKDFKGWQKQKYRKDTVQEEIETSIGILLKEAVNVTGAGRTDTGVNALNHTANFHFHGKIDTNKFKYSLNSLLPGSITVKNVKTVSLDFHSRYSAKMREYLYYICLEKKSVYRDKYYRIAYKPDFVKIDKFLDFIRNQKDFRSFCKNKDDKNNFQCSILQFKYRFFRTKNEIIFSITADRFLHSMVRAILGCALEVGRNKLTLKSIQEKINRGEKIGAHYLPGNALFLNKIFY